MNSKTYTLPNGKKAVFEYDVCGIGKVTLECMDELMGMIAEAPSIDIVRCKECKHNYNKTLNHGKMYPRCDFTDWKLSENDYCSRGEREGE